MAKKGGVPHMSMSWAEQQHLAQENMALRKTLEDWVKSVILALDITVEVGRVLQKRGRLEPDRAKALDLQVRTIDGLLNDIFKPPMEEVNKWRKERNGEEFLKLVNALADRMAPVIVMPPDGKKPGRFML